MVSTKKVNFTKHGSVLINRGDIEKFTVAIESVQEKRVWKKNKKWKPHS